MSTKDLVILSYQVPPNNKSGRNLSPSDPPWLCSFFLLSHMIKMRFGSEIAMGEGLLLVFKLNL